MHSSGSIKFHESRCSKIIDAFKDELADEYFKNYYEL